MNYIDIVVLALVGLAAFKGFRNGFVTELATIIGLVLGLYTAAKFSSFLARVLKDYFKPSIVETVSFLIIFLTIIILVMILAKIVNGFIESLKIGFLNRLMGAIFGGVKALFVISVMFAVFNSFTGSYNFISEETKANSFCYKPVSKIAETVFPFLQFDYLEKEVSNKLRV